MKLLPTLGMTVLLLSPFDDGSKPKPAVVVDLLAVQFTAMDQSGTVDYRFYMDYKDTWILP